MDKVKASELPKGSRFHLGTGDVYVMEHFVELKHRKYFILRNIATGTVFESGISENFMVTPL